MSIVYYFALIIFVMVSLLLCFVILIQESKSMGMGASFGGGDSGDSLFGTSTADVLKKFTGWLALIFMVACIILSAWTASLGRADGHSSVSIEQVK